MQLSENSSYELMPHMSDQYFIVFITPFCSNLRLAVLTHDVS